MPSPIGIGTPRAFTNPQTTMTSVQQERPLTPLHIALSDAATQHLASPPPPPPPIDDPLVNGIKTLLDPTIRQTTEKLLQVHNSQLALSDELERLISRMPLPFLQQFEKTTGPASDGSRTHSRVDMCRATELP